MPLLYVTEYANLMPSPIAGQNVLPIPLEHETMNQGLQISTTSNQSAVFQRSTRLVRLHCEAACHVEFGTNPSAGPGSQRMAANQTEYKAVPVGGAFKVAVIATV
jgi:hypothetical protein